MRILLAIAGLAGALHAAPHRKTPRADVAGPSRPVGARPDTATALPADPTPQASSSQAQRPIPSPAQVSPRRFGRFDLDMPFAQLRAMPDLADCAAALAVPAGHAECLLPRAPDNLARIQLAWEETRTGSELTALRLVFDPQLAPPLTDLEWQLTRGWGPPLLEQLRRERDQTRRFLDWLKSWGPPTKERPVVSVCTGSLLLGAAGYLKALRATTHHNAFDALKPLCREVVTDRRIVEDGRVVTAGGVASSLDLGLYLVEKYWGAAARETIAAQQEYTAYRVV